MSVGKDLGIASGVLVLSITLLAFAFTAPESRAGGDTETQLASAGGASLTGPSTPPLGPSTPEVDDGFDADSIIGPEDLDPGFGSTAAEENGPGLAALADAGDPAGSSSGTAAGTSAESGTVSSPFDDPNLGAGPADPFAGIDDGSEQPGAGEPAVIGPDEGSEVATAGPTGASGTPASTAPVDSEPAGPAVIEPEPVSAPTVASSASRTHRVQRGETLQSISSEYYGTVRRWRSIADANSIGEYDLQIGMELTIPGEQPAAAPAAATGPAAAAAPAAASSGRKYTVKDGDSYYTIARDQLGNAGRFKELEKLAGIPARDLRVGTVITLPATGAARTSGSPSTTRSPATTTSIPAGAKVHVVRDGETLGAISRRHLGTSSRWREIAKANGVSDAANLRVGQKLVIPGASTTGSSAAAATTLAASTGSATTAARGEGAGTWHTIARGDTLQAISQRYFGTTRRHGEIKRANPGLNDRRLVIGAKLWIPGAESTGSSSAPAASPAAASRPAQPEPVSPPPVESPSQPASGGSGVDWNALP